jgi:hypothetical protein
MMKINRTIKLGVALIALLTATATAHPTSAHTTRFEPQARHTATAIKAIHVQTHNAQVTLHLKTLTADNQPATSG